MRLDSGFSHPFFTWIALVIMGAVVTESVVLLYRYRLGYPWAELAANLSDAQAEGWRARFCRTGAYNVETASRCARAITKLPPEAIEALRASMGADATLAPGLLRFSAASARPK